MSDQVKRISIHILIPVFCGFFIYVLWRKLPFLDLDGNIFPLIHTDHTLNWVKYNLPDGLWLYALLTSLYYIWGGKFTKGFVQ